MRTRRVLNLKAIWILEFPERLGFNVHDIFVLYVFDFDNDEFYLYDAQNSTNYFLKKLIETKNKGIKKNFTDEFLSKKFIIDDETFKKLINSEMLVFKQNYKDTVLKMFNLYDMFL